MTRTVRSAAIATLAALAALAAIIAADLTPPVQAQSEDETTGRIVARRLDDGRVEFGWQPADGERVLPTQRYFPATIDHNRWLRSSPVEVGGAEIGRINVRLHDNGRIEFAFTPTNGERIQPRGRYFPANAQVGRWLNSTEITIGPPEDEAPAVGSGFSLSAGNVHTCAIRESGEIECWGNNSDGRADAPAGQFSAVSAGGEHTCGLRETGAVICWGDNYYGETDAPAGRFGAVSAGGEHTCGLRETGAVECWGDNYSGQADAPAGRFSAIGAGGFHSCGLRETGAIECWGRNSRGQADAPAGRFGAVSAGGEHACGLRETGAIECWGHNGYGQTEAPAGRFSAVSAGGYHSCGLRETGAIECWGDNRRGRADAPAGRFSAVSAGGTHTCGLRETGAVECWGANDYGQTEAPAGRFSAVSAGGYHSCGLRETGVVECWGANSYGQADAPAGQFSTVSAGGYHSCGLRETGAVECWGANSYGQTDAPAGQFSTVSAGGLHSCGLRETGSVECWGANDDHDGLPIDFGQANAPAGRFSAVSAGWSHSCGLRGTGAVECWGGIFIPVSRLYSAVSTGGTHASPHSCGLRETGAVECWGFRGFINGDGRTDAPAGRFSAVSAGGGHSCGLLESRAVKCWGLKGNDQTDVPSGRFSSVSAGRSHSCGLHETGMVECWGRSSITDAPSGRFRVAGVAAVAGCPEPTQLFRVTETSPVARRIVREERLDTTCQVDGLPRGAVRPADRYAFTLDKPSRVSVELRSTAFPTHLFLTDANGAYHYLDATEAEGGRRLSLSGSRAADGEGDAIIGSDTGYLPNPGAPVSIPASLNRVRLQPGSYWLFAVSASGSRTGDYRLKVEYERIADSESLDQRIAERFAPVLLFEEGEQFFPVPVELMIRHSTLHYTQNGQERTKAPGTYGLADLISHNGQEAYLDLADADHDATGDRVVYARVAEIDGADNGVLVQYWFFYLYNDTGESIWSHEGDWEGVQMWFAGLDRDDLLTASVPKQLGYAAHESGWVVTRSITCLFFDDPFRPNVYVARNRHASYPEPGGGGSTLDKSFGGWAGDQFQGNGAVWTLPGREAPGAEGELEQYEIRILPSGDQSWLAWDGKWGDKKTGSDGPSGPAFKSHFRNPPALNKGWSGSSGLPVFHCPSASE